MSARKVTPVRLDQDVIARIDAFLARVKERNPDTRPCRSDAIRTLIAKGLEAEGQA